MPGQGIQYLPLGRIPTEWDSVWFAGFCREVLALADTRNALEGAGITITGQPNEQATISTSTDIQNLLLQSYVLAAPSGFLQFERVLAGETGVVTITDGGANGTITVELANGGVNLGKLTQLSDMGVLGNPTNAIGNVQNIQSTATDGETLAVQAGELVFTNAPTWTGHHTWVDNAEVRLGTGGELRIFHDATNSIIRNDGGVLRLQGGANIGLEIAASGALSSVQAADWTGQHRFMGGARGAWGTYAGVSLGQVSNAQGEIWFSADPGAGTADEHIFGLTYSGGAMRLRTFNDAGTVSRDAWRIEQAGAAITSEQFGNSTDNPEHQFFGTLWQIQDNYEIQVGAGRDLRLYHDGTDSFVRNYTGRLRIGGTVTTVSPDLVNFPSGVITSSACLAVGKDSIGGATVDISTFAGNLCGIRCYSANGGVGALAAVTTAANPIIAFLGAAGYDGTNWTGSAGLIAIKPGSNWSTTNYETIATIEVTPNGSTARGIVAQFDGARGTMNVPLRKPRYTVAALPAGAQGDTAVVTDANAPVFGAAVAGGGAVTVPVYYTGAAWFVG